MVLCMFRVHSQLHWFLTSRHKMSRATSASAVSDPAWKKQKGQKMQNFTHIFGAVRENRLWLLSDDRCVNTAPMWPDSESAEFNWS